MHTEALDKTMVFVGYARVPEGTTARELYQLIGLALEVDMESGRVVDASCTLAVPLAEQFVRRLIVGRELGREFEGIVREIEERYHGPTQRAIVTALKAAHERFRSAAGE